MGIYPHESVGVSHPATHIILRPFPRPDTEKVKLLQIALEDIIAAIDAPAERRGGSSNRRRLRRHERAILVDR